MMGLPSVCVCVCACDQISVHAMASHCEEEDTVGGRGEATVSSGDTRRGVHDSKLMGADPEQVCN